MQVDLVDNVLVITFERNARDLTRVKSLPARTWVPEQGEWHAPYVVENYEALKSFGADLSSIPPPVDHFTRVDTHQRALTLFMPPTQRNIRHCRALPDRRTWKPGLNGTGAWVVSATAANVEHILASWPDIHWTPAAREVRDDLVSRREQADELRERKKSGRVVPIGDYRFGGQFTPFEHQRRAFALSRDLEAYALLMEQGTGKTRVVVDTACHLFGRGEIDAVLVVSPNSIKDVWREEVETHSPDHYQHEVMVYDSGLKKAERERLKAHVHDGPLPGKLRWLAINIEALSRTNGRGYKLAHLYVANNRTLTVVDESSRIKTPSAKRTRNTIKLGRDSGYRRILTGTPVTQGPLDLFSQFRFLDPHILGYSSFYSFRNRYAVVRKVNGYPEILGYQYLDELQDKIEPYSFRVTRDECLDLPPKVYQRIEVDLSPEQRRIFDELRTNMRAEMEGREITTPIVLTQLLRLQQVTGGFLPPPEVDPLLGAFSGELEPEPIPGKNPKVAALLELVDDLDRDKKVVVWSRFRAEIDLIARSLRDAYGAGSVAEFHGGVTTEDRSRARHRFQGRAPVQDERGERVGWRDVPEDEQVRFFVAQTETGGMGITLTAASTVVYFSNSFSLESRLQSEDRCHRIGQERSVTYIDIVARDTRDHMVLGALRSKKNLANLITGDEWKSWI